MAVRYNPVTGGYDPIDPNSFAMSSGDDYFDPVLGDIDPLNEHKGVGGGAGDNSYSSVGVDPSTLWDPTKGIDWNKLKQFITSPQGIAGLGGAALGYLDRPKPTGGGTTMAYPGAAQLTRKMVQGPYGPLAEYTGVGGGTPDYRPITAPTFGAPDVGGRPAAASTAGTGMSMQSKVDLYRQLAGYGLGADRIRRIAETMYGAIPDAEWSELTRLAGTTGGATGGIRTDAGARTAAAGGERVGVDAGRGGIGYGAGAAPEFFSQQPSFTRLSRTSTPSQISAAYDEFVASRGGDTEANRAEALQFLQSKGVSQSKINDAYSKFQKGETVAEITGLPQKDWEKAATFAARETPRSRTLGVWRDPTSGKGIAVQSDSRGQPANFRYINEEGVALNSSIFNASDLYENADKLGIDLSNIWQLGDLLDEKGVKYKPYELYQGTGSDHGINFQDIAQGGLGTAYDWTKDPLAHLKGPTGVTSLQADQQLASRLGITANPFVTTGRGLDPSQLRTYERGPDRHPWVAYDDAQRAAFFRTEQEAKNYAAQQGGTYTRIANLDRGPIPATNFAPDTSGLDLASSTGIANAYNQYLASQQGGDTAASRAQAQQFLQSQGVAQPLINQAYNVYKEGLTNPQGIASAYNEFISSRGGDTEANRAEALQYLQNQGIAQPMINQAYDVFKQKAFARGGEARAYAGGEPLTMEDGGFVFTEEATRKLGPQGIAALGGKMISAPGNGTDDKGITGIIGRNGVTPARVSNGEAYFPPGHDTKKLYALMHSLERKA